MINVGIIGYGRMGQIRREAVEASGRARVVSIMEPNAAIDLNGAPRAETADDVINNPAVQAVFVCTPNNLNKTLTIRALNAGKHVFCEKPPAFTAADVAEIREA